MSSLAIDPDDVTEVLLADGWHEVDKDSFDLDAYEYITERTTDEDGNESSEALCYWQAGSPASVRLASTSSTPQDPMSLVP